MSSAHHQFTLTSFVEAFPIKGKFTIARGSKTEAVVIRVQLEKDGIAGQGECLPYGRYGETTESVLHQIEQIVSAGISLNRQNLQSFPSGAARNAVDCALWDYECKQAKKSIWDLTGIQKPDTLETVYTLSVGSPDEVQNQIQTNPLYSFYKIKSAGRPDDIQVLETVMRTVPEGTKIMVDANESWSIEHYKLMMPLLQKHGVLLLEQPFSADNEQALKDLPHLIPVYADESFHGLKDIDCMKMLYDGVNIKLDKTGGLTEALQVLKEAKQHGLGIMTGSMLATSLSMLPACVIGAESTYVDLDSPLLLATDRPQGLTVEKGNYLILQYTQLWG